MLTAARHRERSEVGAALWRARWLVLVAALVVGVGGYLVSGLQAPSYSAESRLVLRAVEEFDPLGRQSYTDSTRFVANQASVLGSGPVISAAARDLGGGLDREELAEAVDISASADAAVLVVQATGPTGPAAADRADAVVLAYRDYVRQRIAERVVEASAVTTDPVVIDQITTQAASYGDGLAVVDSAEVPERPAGPAPARDGLLLAAVAALVTGGIALLRRSSASPARAAGANGVRTLGSVVVPRGGAPGVADPDAFAVPLVSLGYVADLSAGALLVTGLSERSAAADVALGLATAAGAQGQRVLLVDACPAGRPLLARTGLAAPRRPLTDLVSGASEDDVLVELPGATGSGAVHIAVLGADSGAPFPAGDAVPFALKAVLASHDLVVLSTAPVVDSALALSLLGHATTVVVAMGAREGTERLPELEQRLELARTPLAGSVTTVAPRKSSRGGRIRRWLTRGGGTFRGITRPRASRQMPSTMPPVTATQSMRQKPSPPPPRKITRS